MSLSKPDRKKQAAEFDVAEHKAYLATDRGKKQADMTDQFRWLLEKYYTPQTSYKVAHLMAAALALLGDALKQNVKEADGYTYWANRVLSKWFRASYLEEHFRVVEAYEEAGKTARPKGKVS